MSWKKSGHLVFVFWTAHFLSQSSLIFQDNKLFQDFFFDNFFLIFSKTGKCVNHLRFSRFSRTCGNSDKTDSREECVSMKPQCNSPPLLPWPVSLHSDLGVENKGSHIFVSKMESAKVTSMLLFSISYISTFQKDTAQCPKTYLNMIHHGVSGHTVMKWPLHARGDQRWTVPVTTNTYGGKVFAPFKRFSFYHSLALSPINLKPQPFESLTSKPDAAWRPLCDHKSGRFVFPLTVKRVERLAVSNDGQRVVVVELVVELVRVGVVVSGLGRAGAVVRRVMLLAGVVRVAALRTGWAQTQAVRRRKEAVRKQRLRPRLRLRLRRSAHLSLPWGVCCWWLSALCLLSPLELCFPSTSDSHVCGHTASRSTIHPSIRRDLLFLSEEQLSAATPPLSSRQRGETFRFDSFAFKGETFPFMRSLLFFSYLVFVNFRPQLLHVADGLWYFGLEAAGISHLRVLLVHVLHLVEGVAETTHDVAVICRTLRKRARLQKHLDCLSKI